MSNLNSYNCIYLTCSSPEGRMVSGQDTQSFILQMVHSWYAVVCYKDNIICTPEPQQLSNWLPDERSKFQAELPVATSKLARLIIPFLVGETPQAWDHICI